MRITVLAVPDCPNTALLWDRVAAVLGDRKADVEYIEVHDAEEATARGMAGSPTVLVDGVDVTGASAVSGLACRITAPSTAHLEAAFASAAR